MTAALVLAAGLGTRLRPLTDHVPKAAVPVGDRPALLHAAARAGEVGRVVVNAFHQADAVAALCDASGLALSRETALLGTAGGLRHAASLLGPGDALVWNADIVGDLDARALVAEHEARGALATLAVQRGRPVGRGTVGLGGSRDVVRLRGEVFGEEREGADFLGIHVVGPALRAELPELGCLVGDVYLPALRRGARLSVVAVSGVFFDIGTPATYLEANLAWLAARSSSADGSFLGAGARVGAAGRAHRSVVGARALVEAELTECVVWPDTHVTRPASRAIVTPFGTFSPQGPGARASQ